MRHLFCTVFLLIISCIYLFAGEMQFPNKNFKITIPDGFTPSTNQLDQKVADQMVYYGADDKGDSIIILVGEGNIIEISNESSFLASFKKGAEQAGGTIESTNIEEINGQKYLVLSGFNESKEAATGSFVTCADNHSIMVCYIRQSSHDLSFDRDPDVRALINSFRFLEPPVEPKAKDGWTSFKLGLQAGTLPGALAGAIVGGLAVIVLRFFQKKAA